MLAAGALLGAVVVALAACGGHAPPAPQAGSPSAPSPVAAGPSAPATAVPPAGAPPAAAPARTARSGIDPERVRIPAIGVDATVIDLGLQDDGTLAVPEDARATGWWSRGVQPGDRGPAVVVGHVDSRTGPAVFARLTELRPGDEIELADSGGRTVRFVVERTEQHPKDAFPTEAVYGHTVDPTLHLVTCGGRYDRSARSHEDNVVVFAALPDG